MQRKTAVTIPYAAKIERIDTRPEGCWIC